MNKGMKGVRKKRERNKETEKETKDKCIFPG